MPLGRDKSQKGTAPLLETFRFLPAPFRDRKLAHLFPAPTPRASTAPRTTTNSSHPPGQGLGAAPLLPFLSGGARATPLPIPGARGIPGASSKLGSSIGGPAGRARSERGWAPPLRQVSAHPPAKPRPRPRPAPTPACQAGRGQQLQTGSFPSPGAAPGGRRLPPPRPARPPRAPSDANARPCPARKEALPLVLIQALGFTHAPSVPTPRGDPLPALSPLAAGQEPGWAVGLRTRGSLAAAAAGPPLERAAPCPFSFPDTIAHIQQAATDRLM